VTVIEALSSGGSAGGISTAEPPSPGEDGVAVSVGVRPGLSDPPPLQAAKPTIKTRPTAIAAVPILIELPKTSPLIKRCDSSFNDAIRTLSSQGSPPRAERVRDSQGPERDPPRPQEAADRRAGAGGVAEAGVAPSPYYLPVRTASWAPNAGSGPTWSAARATASSGVSPSSAVS